MKKIFLLCLVSCVFVSMPETLFACSVCFGDPNSLQAKALGGAVLFLLVIIGGILSAIASLAFIWSRRAKELSETSGISVS